MGRVRRFTGLWRVVEGEGIAVIGKTVAVAMAFSTRKPCPSLTRTREALILCKIDGTPPEQGIIIWNGTELRPLILAINDVVGSYISKKW